MGNSLQSFSETRSVPQHSGDADRRYISRSHARCRNYGIDTDRIYSSRFITDPELFEILETKQDLIVAAEPFLHQLYDFVKGSGFFAILTDENGCILKMIGDEIILAKAFALKMIPGAYMDERSIGTNAMGTALAEGMPVQISGKEHFVEAYHRWTCSGAPIRNADGAIIGALDLTGNREHVHSHTLGMVVAAANAIEKILCVQRYTSELSLSKRYTETIIDSLSAGIVTADPGGTIKTVSKKAAEMFGYDADDMRRMRAWEIFEGWDDVHAALAEKRSFQEEDISVNARKNKTRFSLSAYPLLDQYGSVRDVILVFKELRKVRKLANKIAGHPALYTFDKIIGKNRSFLRAVDFAKKMADSRSTLLILGESGTGKELFAQAVHNHSSRKDEAFVVINCGALPRTLIESELFGYEEGAFTGAKQTGQPGKFEIADGGTIFLDEIGEMPLDLQTRLLRVIEEGVVCRVGSPQETVVDVRVIAATNKDLRAEVESGNFRRDLYYRLNVLPLVLPPLRERKDDIPLLIDFFMSRLSKRLNKKPVRFPDAYLARLMDHDWPGNVRELENLIELIINTETIVPVPGTRALRNAPGADEPPRGLIREDGFEPVTLEEIERLHILRTLKKHNGNMSLCARTLGIGRTTLYRKIESMGLDCSIPERCPD